jgi:hypothetical protein
VLARIVSCEVYENEELSRTIQRILNVVAYTSQRQTLLLELLHTCQQANAVIETELTLRVLASVTPSQRKYAVG